MNIAWYFQRTWRQIFKVAQDGLFIAHAQVRWASLLFEAKNSALFYKFGIVLRGILGLFRMDFRSFKRPKFSHCSHYSFTSFFNFHSRENGEKLGPKEGEKSKESREILGKNQDQAIVTFNNPIKRWVLSLVWYFIHYFLQFIMCFNKSSPFDHLHKMS